MSFYEKIGKGVVIIISIVVAFILIIAILAFFGILTPEETSQVDTQTSAAEQELIQNFEDMNLEFGRYLVYLQEDKFDDADNSIVNIKLKLSDIEIKSASINHSQTDKSDLINLITSYKSLADGLNIMIDARKTGSQKNVLTWDVYNSVLQNTIDARNKFADFYNQANKIQDANLKESLDLITYKTTIDEMDKQISDMQSTNMTELVQANTFISKINPLESGVRSTAASIEKEYGIELNQRLVGIIAYFSQNMNYVHIPNWNPESNIQFIQSPETTLTQKGGNCADLSILFDSLAESIGVSTKFCFADTTHTITEIQKDQELFESNHAVIQYLDEEDNWLTLDVTCYAGTDLMLGDECNQAVEYVVKCYDVQKFREGIKSSVIS